MRRERLDSSSLRSVGYDASSRVLEVEFRNGGVYQYLDVKDDEYEEFQDADSKGRYLNTEIKLTHRFRRLKKPN